MSYIFKTSGAITLTDKEERLILKSTLGQTSGTQPLVHLKMNDNAESNTVVDSMSNFNGTLNGGDNTDDLSSTGKINTSLNFNGTDDYIQVNHGTQSIFSYCMWVYCDPTDQNYNNPFGNQVKIFWSQDDNPSINLYSSYKIGVSIKEGDESTHSAVGTSTLQTNTWTHITITFDGTDLKIYINGVLEDTEDVVGRGALYNVSRIARDDAGRYFKGKIDDFRAYNCVINQTDIENIYNGGVGTEQSNINLIRQTLTAQESITIKDQNSSRLTIREVA